MSNDKDYEIFLNISKFVDTEIHKREVDGEEVDCVSIPIAKNEFKIYKNGNVWCKLLMKQFAGKYGCTHYLKPFLSKNKYKEFCENGWGRHIAFIGNARPKFFKKKFFVRKSLDDILKSE